MRAFSRAVAATVLTGVIALGAAVRAQEPPAQSGNAEFTASEKATLSLYKEFVKCALTEQGPFTAEQRAAADAKADEALAEMKKGQSGLPGEVIDGMKAQVARSILVTPVCETKTGFNLEAAAATFSSMATKYGQDRMTRTMTEIAIEAGQAVKAAAKPQI